MEFIEEKLFFIERRNIKKLTDIEINSLLKLYSNINCNYLFNINNDIFHMKKVYIEDVLNELLGKIISEYFGSKKIESNLIKDDNNRVFLLNNNFIKEGSRYVEFDSGVFPNIIYDEKRQMGLFNLNLLDKIKFNDIVLDTNKDDLVKLKNDLKIMIISDFIRKQSDRWYYNFLIEQNCNCCRLMPLYDFEYSFLEYTKLLDNSFKFDLKNRDEVNYIRNDEGFQELLYKAMDMNMKDIYDKLVSEYPISVGLNEYSKYEKIINVKKDEIKKYKLIK